MLKLNTDEIRNLQFEVSIEGVNYDELEGSLKFIIEDVEYGIPVKIQKDLVSVEVPPLEEIVARGMKDGDIVECKLDIFGNGFYINPWGGQFELATPVKIEAKNLRVEAKHRKKDIVAELKPSKPVSNNLDKEAILEMLFEKLEERGYVTTQKPKEIINPEPLSESKEVKLKPKNIKQSPLTRQQLVEQKIKNKFKQVNSLVKRVKSLTEGKKVISKPKAAPVIKPVTERRFGTGMADIMDKVNQLKNGTKPRTSIPRTTGKVEEVIHTNPDDPIMLMESVGMKNPKMQKIMMDKAIELGGDGDKGISLTLRKLLGIDQPNPYEHYNKS